MSFKLEPVIWSRDTGHIDIHGGVTKTKFSHIDELPYFLNYGASSGAPLLGSRDFKIVHDGRLGRLDECHVVQNPRDI